MKNRLLIILALLCLTGCASRLEKAKTTFWRDPIKFAVDCDRAFPIDTTKKIVVVRDTAYIKANNEDYTKRMDSIVLRNKELEDMALKDTTDCGKKYLPKIQELLKDNKRLRDGYKPCEPDTLKIRNTLTITQKVIDGAKFKAIEADRDNANKLKGVYKTIMLLLLAIVIVGLAISLLRRR